MWKSAGPQLALPLALCCALHFGCDSGPDEYPSREIRLVVQAAPGGLSDTVSRVAASLAEQDLGVPVVCENRPGAAGALAFSYVTRQPADGYTIGHGPVEIAMVRALGYADIGPEKMDLLCLFSKTQPVLAVLAGAKWSTLEEFVEEARTGSRGLIIGNSGTGSIWHINAMLLERSAGMRVIHCPFSGSSGALAALLGGHVDAVVAGSGEVVSHVNAGRVRVLAVLERDRSSLFPEVPSSVEAGFGPGTSTWGGFYAPKGLPAERRTRLIAALRSAFESPEFQKLCEERGMDPVFLEGDDFRAFAESQAVFFSQTIPVLLKGQEGR